MYEKSFIREIINKDELILRSSSKLKKYKIVLFSLVVNHGIVKSVFKN